MTTTTTSHRTRDDRPRLETFHTSGVWQGGLHTRVAARQFALDIDEPPAIGGADEGATPIEYVLASLNGCVTVVIQTVAKELGIRVGGIETKAAGTLDLRGFLGTADVSPHFQELTLSVTLTTTAGEQELSELRAQVDTRCPLLNLIKDAGVEPRVTWHVVSA